MRSSYLGITIDRSRDKNLSEQAETLISQFINPWEIDIPKINGKKPDKESSVTDNKANSADAKNRAAD